MALPPYASAAYVAALGTVLPVAAWGGAALWRRPIDGGALHDAASGYPLLPFDAGWDVGAGLHEIAASGAVSLTLVTCPLSPCPAPHRFAHRRDYKRHHLVLGGAGAYQPNAHHRRRIRDAARRVEVGAVALAEVLDDWGRLQAALAARRGFIGALHDFPRATIAAWAALGLRAFAAWQGGIIVGMGLWFRHADTAWYHLGAADDTARESGAGHALMDVAIRALLADGVTRIVLGGGLQPIGGAACGLDRFKAGFGNAARPNQLLGAVLDAAACARLGGAFGSFFPAYRAPRTAA